jgi:uncharacterized surface protein with fasciclin (FAS1) repeats
MGTSALARALGAAALTLSLAAPGLADEKIVTTFDGTNDLDWEIVNDDVMGGVSQGGFEVTPADTLLYTGATSLENNGGFSSIRSRHASLGLRGFDGLSITLRGDGRPVWITLRTGRLLGPIMYWTKVETRPEQWTTVRVPFSDFRPMMFGRELARPALRVWAISSIGFMIYDKTAGPFTLEVDRVAAYEGQTSPAAPTIAEAASGAGTFTTLLAAVDAAGLTEALVGPGPLTVFAPTDEAFARLPEGQVASLLRPENRDALRRVLSYHVVSGALSVGTLEAGDPVTTLAGAALTFRKRSDLLLTGSASVTTPGIPCSNGVVYVIDRVLLPPPAAAPSGDEARPAPTADTASSEVERARRLIELAVQRGAPLFNQGQQQACTAIYELTASALLELGDGLFSAGVRETLRESLVAPDNDESTARHAWKLRRALDAAYSELGSV